MRNIVPTQVANFEAKRFPVEGQQRNDICTIVAMELFGCPVGYVAEQLGKTVDEVINITNSPDYAYVKQNMVATIRKMDRNTLAGKVSQEAQDAFDRMTELASNARREDVRFSANKDILDRAMLNGIAGSGQADELRITFVKRR